MRTRPYSPWFTRAYIFCLATLGLTGVLQMPLAKRYALTEVPGLAWTGDFYLVHRLHYMLAALLLFVVALAATNWWRSWKKRLRLTPLGLARVVVVAILLVSGGLRVYRNMPGVTLDPAVIVTIEWVHLVFAMALGALALVAVARGVSMYVRWRG